MEAPGGGWPLNWTVLVAALGASVASADISSEIEDFVSAQADSGYCGCVLLSIDDEVVVESCHGYADPEQKAPLNVETPLWVASISKQFTAVAILHLVEAGRLSLDDPIAKHLPSVPADKRSITVHQLLTHSAGLSQRYAADGIADRDEATAALLEGALEYPPGEGFGYSNDAYNLLAIVVERLAGEAFENYLQRELLRPAGLTATGFWGPPAHPEVAPILAEDGRDVSDPVLQPSWGFRGATGMFASAGDLWRWQIALWGDRLLRPESREQLLRAHLWRAGGEIGVGYGWFLSPAGNAPTQHWTRGYESFGHGGWLSYEPERRRVLIVNSNSGEHPSGDPWSHWMARQLLQLLEPSAD